MGWERVFFTFICLFSLWLPAKEFSCPQALLQKENARNSIRIHATPRLQIPAVIKGSDERVFQSPRELSEPVVELFPYDTIVVGGGLAGLTAANYLSEHQQKVLVLEKDSEFGGLAAGGTRGGFNYARGAAYFSPPNDTTLEIFKHFGLGDYETKFHIREPIDSYMWNGKLYPGIWEEPTLSTLPSSFALFKYVLEETADEIPDQPMEDSGQLDLDSMTAAEWIRQMPKYVLSKESPAAKEILNKFRSDTRLSTSDPMKEVIDFLDLYSRSALGRETNEISATAFANFYISELVPRFTGQFGSGDIAQQLKSLLNQYQGTALKNSSLVSKIESDPNGVRVTYVRGGVVYQARARKLVFSAQLGMAQKLIKDFDVLAPEHHRILSSIEYAHYLVHNVFLEGHPWRGAYDLWIRNADYTIHDPTDAILGLWQNHEIDGYNGMRNFEKDPAAPVSVLSIYQPLPKGTIGSGLTDEQVLEYAEKAYERVRTSLEPYTKSTWGTSFKPQMIEINRWPNSIHIVKPGWLANASILKQVINHNIYLANNNLGVPSVEEALYRGRQAAYEILGIATAEDISAVSN